MARNVGWIDTNVVVHALTNDPVSERCRTLVQGLDSGEVEGSLDPTVIHELSYVLPRVVGWDRTKTAEFLVSLLLAPGVHVRGGKGIVVDAITRWARHGTAFVDALLVARAAEEGSPVCTVNARDISRLGGLPVEP